VIAVTTISGIDSNAPGVDPAIYFLCVVSFFLYPALTVGSRLQASLGMMAFRIYVSDLDGDRLSCRRVLGRQLLKLLVYGTTCFLLLPTEGLIRVVIYIVAHRVYQKQTHLRRGQWLSDMASKTVVLAGKPSRLRIVVTEDELARSFSG